MEAFKEIGKGELSRSEREKIVGKSVKTHYVEKGKQRNRDTQKYSPPQCPEQISEGI